MVDRWVSVSFVTASWNGMAWKGPLKIIYSSLPAMDLPMELGTLMQALKITAIHCRLATKCHPTEKKKKRIYPADNFQ